MQVAGRRPEMNLNLFTRQGQKNLLLLIAGCAGLLIVPFYCLNAGHGATVRAIGNVTLGVVWLALIGTIACLQLTSPTPIDILDAADAEKAGLEATDAALATVREKKNRFLRASSKEKILQVGLALLSVFLFVYGMLDCLNVLSPGRIPTMDGRYISVSHWASGLTTIIISVVPFVLMMVSHRAFADRWEERFKELLRQVQDDIDKGRI